MKLGMPILYEFNSIKENVKLANELNLDFIELNLNFGYCRKEIENTKQLLNDLKDTNLELTLHFYDEADFGSYDEVVNAYIKLLKYYLSKAKKLNIKLLNIHLNEGPIVTIGGEKNYIYEKEFDNYIIRLINNLKKVKKICDKYNVGLVIENIVIPKYLVNTYKRLKEEGFAFNYDIGHDHTSNDTFKLEILDNDINIKEFHIHDSTKSKCHLEIGTGELDLKFYKGLSMQSYVVLEVKNSNDLINSVETFKNI